MANDEPEPGPYNPPPGVFVRFENGRTLVQLTAAFEENWLAPFVQIWTAVAARCTAARPDELADAWVAAGREVSRHKRTPPPCHRAAQTFLEGLREQWKDSPQSPGYVGGHREPSMALRWVRLAVPLLEAGGKFTAAHQLAGAELAASIIEADKRQAEWEDAPVIQAGTVFLKARQKEQEAKEPARMAIETRNTEICKTARERRDGGKSRVSTVEFLMKEHNLGQRSIDEILKAGEVFWGKTP